jgi:hypothetical protein
MTRRKLLKSALICLAAAGAGIPFIEDKQYLDGSAYIKDSADWYVVSISFEIDIFVGPEEEEC